MSSEQIENILQPQGIRTPSGRREDSTVPEVLPSSSSEGPALSLPTGEERKLVTIATETEVELRDPIDLTFIDCLSIIENSSNSNTSNCKRLLT